jgi:hypothetical protein
MVKGLRNDSPQEKKGREVFQGMDNTGVPLQSMRLSEEGKLGRKNGCTEECCPLRNFACLHFFSV